MSSTYEQNKRRYWRIKADPEQYAELLRQKREYNRARYVPKSGKRRWSPNDGPRKTVLDERIDLSQDRAALQTRVNELKILGGCVDCGYNQHPRALDFDHLPEFQKDFTVSYAVLKNFTWESIETEIAKCEIRCSNCHRVKTSERNTMRRYKECHD